MKFKEKLRALRKEKGISQQALADAAFVSRSAVAKWACVLVLVLVLFMLLFAVSVPLVNDYTAAMVEERLVRLPLPENTVLIESVSRADKMVGNGNGMQYLGAILIQSDLSLKELEAHYARYRIDQWDCLIGEQDNQKIDFIEIGVLSFETELDATAEYYIVYSWGDGIDLYEQLDLRGH